MPEIDKFLDNLDALFTNTPEEWSFDERSVRVDGLLESGEVEPSVGILHVYRMKNPVRRRSIGRFIVAMHNAWPAVSKELRENRERIANLEAELAIYKAACAATRQRSLADATHTMMNAAVGNVSGLFEAEHGPCEALRRAEMLLRPAWDAWSTLMARLEYDPDAATGCADDQLPPVIPEFLRQMTPEGLTAFVRGFNELTPEDIQVLLDKKKNS